MKKIILVSALAVVLAACGNTAMETSYNQNGARVEKIAVIEGCNVYRLNEAHYVYVTICPSKEQVNTQTSVNCGKGCTRPQFSMTTTKSETEIQ